jgi:type VI secretion system protein ImpF
MSRVDPLLGLTASVLDRLCEPHTGNQSHPGISYEQLVRSVVRDVEDLLNTRQMPLPPAIRQGPLGRSLLAYGLPDLSSLGGSLHDDTSKIAAALETTISRFEPRLQNVRVAAVTREDGRTWHLHFRIDAELTIEPHPHVSLETVLELTGGRHHVRRLGG